MKHTASLSAKLVRIGAGLLVVALISIGLTLWVTWKLTGEVVRQMEEDFTMVECFSEEGSNCRIDGRCQLKGVLSQALQAYMQVLDGVRLSDLVVPGGALAKVTWR